MIMTLFNLEVVQNPGITRQAACVSNYLLAFFQT
jgi:hypothetical protein